MDALTLALLNQATDTRVPSQKPGLGLTLSDLMTQQAQQQLQQTQAETGRYNLEQARREQQALQGIDLSSPDAAVKLMRINPELGIKLMQQQRLQQQQLLGEQLMQQAMGGGGVAGGGDADLMAAAADMSGYPALANMYGRIAERQAEQSRFERTQTAEQEKAVRGASIPGYDIMPDVQIDPATARGARGLATAIPVYENAIKKIEKLIDKHGSAVGAGKDVDEVSQAFNDLLNAERSLNETGVLNVGEIPILEKVYAPFDPRNPMNLMKSKDQMKADAKQYLADRKALIKGKLGALGYIDKSKPQITPADALAELERRRKGK